MFLIGGVLTGLLGLVLLGVSGNERSVGNRRRTRPLLAWVSVLLILLGIGLAIAGPHMF